MLDMEITDKLIIETLTMIGREGTGHELFQVLKVKSSYLKEKIRIHLNKMVFRGIITKVPVTSLNKPLIVGNRGSVKWGYKIP